jgi:acetyltransferase-like isoleucine patch superfamily enzyme
MDQAMDRPKFFMSWRDMVLTPLVWTFTLAVPALLARYWAARYQWNLLIAVACFFILVVLLTLAVIGVIRKLFPLHAGIYNVARNPWAVYNWNLIGFLCVTNLAFQYLNSLIPPPFRKLFYGLLGAKMGRGMIIISGRIIDPQFVSIGESAVLGDDSLILAHALTAERDLILGEVRIEAGAVIGARAVVMPGVTIGANSMVKAMSLVAMNTKIPPNEVWGGVPARKM